MTVVPRDRIPAHVDGKVFEGEHVIYMINHRRAKHATDLLLACWHDNGWNPWQKRSFFVLRDDQDWFLFKIANAITEYQTAEIV